MVKNKKIAMTKKTGPSAPKPSEAAKPPLSPREKKLEDALRQNLARRKAQDKADK